jgi:hypothetical protein
MGDNQLVPVLIRGSGASIPFVYLSDPGIILTSGSGSPSAMRVSSARWGAVYFKKAFNAPSAAGITVLTSSAATAADPTLRFSQAGFYRVSIRWTGHDVTSYTATDWRYKMTIGSNDYAAIDQFHSALPASWVNFNTATGDGWPTTLTKVVGAPEPFGGFANHSGGDPPATSLTAVSWGDDVRQGSGFFYRNFDSGNELRFTMVYGKGSGMSTTQVQFELDSYDVEIARIGDKVTETTYTM